MSGMGGGYGGGWDDPDQFEIQQLQQKQQLAQQMLAGMKPTGSRASGLMGILGAFLAAKQMKDANEGMQAVGDRMNQRRQADIGTMADFLSMKPKAGIAPQAPLAPNDDEGNAMPMSPGVPGETPEAFQERKAALARTMIGSRNPQLQQLGMQALMPQPKDYKTVKAGEKLVDFSSGAPREVYNGGIDTSHFAPKDYTPESYAAFLKSNNPADLRRHEKPDLDAVVIMGPDGKPMVNPLAVEAKKQIAAAGRAPAAPRLQYDPERGITVDLNTGQAVPVTQGGQPVGPKQEKLPAAIQTQLAQNNVTLSKINSALQLLGTPVGKNAIGPVNRVPGWELVNQYKDPEGTQTRAMIADIGSQKIHDRSGAAVTISETPRLLPFVPSVGDRPDVARTKLENLQREYQMMQQELSRGGSLSSTIAARSPGGGASRQPVSQADLEATARKYGMTVDQVKQKLGIQ